MFVKVTAGDHHSARLYDVAGSYVESGKLGVPLDHFPHPDWEGLLLPVGSEITVGEINVLEIDKEPKNHLEAGLGHIAVTWVRWFNESTEKYLTVITTCPVFLLNNQGKTIDRV